jgi:hypothetical protein
LTTYQPKGDFEIQELIINDFEEYYLNDSKWGQNYTKKSDAEKISGNPPRVRSFTDDWWYFRKNEDGIWQYGVTEEKLSGKGDFVEIIGEVAPIDDNFELYKTPEPKQTVTEAVSDEDGISNELQAKNVLETKKAVKANTQKNIKEDTNNTPKTLIIVLLTLAGVAILYLIIRQIKKIKKP